MSDRITMKTVIGRFELFHNGHAALIESALNANYVLVLVGSANRSRTTKNPWNFDERAAMIRDWYDDWIREDIDNEDDIAAMHERLVIKPLNDHPYNEAAWIAEVQFLVNEGADIAQHHHMHLTGHMPEVSKILTGCDRDESTYYLNAFGTFFDSREILDLENKVSASLAATQLRTKLFEGDLNVISKDVPHATFRYLTRWVRTEDYVNLEKEFAYLKEYKRIWAAAPYAPTFVTVDAVVIQSGHILVNVRDNFPGTGCLALPGGFLDQNETIRTAIIRELKEETAIKMSDAQLHGSIKEIRTFDDPNRSLRGRTITHAALIQLNDAFPLPKVKPQVGEVRKCSWVPLSDALKDPTCWFEDHYFIIKELLGMV